MDWDYKHFLISHLAWVVIFAVVLIGGYQYIQSAKALSAAEAREAAAKEVIKGLNGQIATRDKDITDLKTTMATRDAQTQSQIAALSKAIVNVKTPEQVVASLPIVTDLPLNAKTIPNSSQIAVDAQPLFQGLAACKQQSLELTSCKADLVDEKKIADNLTANVGAQTQIIAEKDKVIDGYKKAAGHHGFFGKLWQGTQKVGLLGIGLALGKVI